MDHSGYLVSELFVNKKYSSFGQEILNHYHKYIDINIIQFKKLIIKKANNYLKTEKVKGIEAWDSWDNLHYGIKRGGLLELGHLLSIILYCDTTSLSTAFSSTFRARVPFEPLTKIKKRNQNYWHWTKYIRETVEIFGYYARKGGVSYYTGLSCILKVPSFSIRLCSPTSTSVHLSVALKFSGEQGCIMEMKPRKYGFIRTFDCSWISSFVEEDERYDQFLCLFLFIFLFQLFSISN